MYLYMKKIGEFRIIPRIMWRPFGKCGRSFNCFVAYLYIYKPEYSSQAVKKPQNYSLISPNSSIINTIYIGEFIQKLVGTASAPD